MTFEEVLNKFEDVFPFADVDDYRPICHELFTDGKLGITIWLKNGDVIEYYPSTESEVEEMKNENVQAIPMEDWLRGCVYHDGRNGNVTLPCDRVLEIANYIQMTRASLTEGLIGLRGGDTE